MSKLVVIIWWFAVVGSGWLLPLFRWSWLEIGFQRLVLGSADGNLFLLNCGWLDGWKQGFRHQPILNCLIISAILTLVGRLVGWSQKGIHRKHKLKISI